MFHIIYKIESRQPA